MKGYCTTGHSCAPEAGEIGIWYRRGLSDVTSPYPSPRSLSAMPPASWRGPGHPDTISRIWTQSASWSPWLCQYCECDPGSIIVLTILALIVLAILALIARHYQCFGHCFRLPRKKYEAEMSRGECVQGVRMWDSCHTTKCGSLCSAHFAQWSFSFEDICI